MKINVILSQTQVDELYFSGRTTIIVDVLRATSTIVEALNNGAKEVIPVSSFEFAMKASGSFF
jgi:2-phosphosulfolactate phosphatase